MANDDKLFHIDAKRGVGVGGGGEKSTPIKQKRVENPSFPIDYQFGAGLSAYLSAVNLLKPVNGK